MMNEFILGEWMNAFILDELHARRWLMRILKHPEPEPPDLEEHLNEREPNSRSSIAQTHIPSSKTGAVCNSPTGVP